LGHRFDQLFGDGVYLELKNSLFSYLLRKRLVRRITQGEARSRLLDLGSGISPVAPPSRSVVYADVSPRAMRMLRSELPGAHYVALDATRLPFRSESLDALVCSEVLEHIQEDRSALREMYRVLRPGGRLILTVPINPYLYTFDDRYVGHFRRYRLRELVETLEEIGFSGIRRTKVAGLLEKAATYAMVRLFARVDRSRQEQDGKRWWFALYRVFNYIWSYLAAWEGRVSPWRLITIVLLDCRRP
jgi:SAM-dependent methyltransferase